MSFTLNPSSQIVDQTSDVELFLTLKQQPSTTFITVNSLGKPIVYAIEEVGGQTDLAGLVPGKSYRISVRDMVNKGINIAATSYRETTKSRIAIQHTLQGIFIDPYKTAPPVLTITFAVEMPQGAYTKIPFEHGNIIPLPTPTGFLNALGQIGEQAVVGAVNAISPTLGAITASLFTSSIKPPTVQNTWSFTEIMSAVETITSAKNTPNIAELYFIDFGRQAFEKISILNISQKASASPLNVLFYTLTCAVLETNTVPKRPASINNLLPNSAVGVIT